MADRSPKKSGKRPSYQWYPGDFRRDTGVQACSFGARALWREMLDLMHDGEPYGHLTAGGVSITPRQLSRIIGVSTAKIERWLAELQDRNVFSRTERRVIFSRRMVRDEHIRNVRRKAGKKGGNPKLLLKQTVKQKETPAVATTATGSLQSAIALDPEVVAAGARALSVMANKGLAEHESRPQPIARIIASSAPSYTAAEAILQAGVPLPFAESHVYAIAHSHRADGEVRSLRYFTDAVIRSWHEHQAGETAKGAVRPPSASIARNGPRRAPERKPPQTYEYTPTKSEKEIKWQD